MLVSELLNAMTSVAVSGEPDQARQATEVMSLLERFSPGTEITGQSSPSVLSDPSNQVHAAMNDQGMLRISTTRG